MLPGLGFSEILVLGVIALLVVGPKDLPVMLRELGRWSRKMQAMAAEFRQGFDELARQAELDELRKEVDAMRQAVQLPDLETALTAPVIDGQATTVVEEPPAMPAPVVETTTAEPLMHPVVHEAAAMPADKVENALMDALSNDDEDVESSRAPLLDHLTELRTRLFIAVVAISAASAVAFFFAARLQELLVEPYVTANNMIAAKNHLPPPEIDMIFTQPMEQFFAQLKIALSAGVVVAFPVVAYQLYAFVAPGLYKREKNAVLPFMIAAPVMFVIGAAFAYFVAIPFAMTFAMNTQIDTGKVHIKLVPKVNEYLSFVITLILAFGACFQLPVVLSLMARAGLVGAGILRKGRRFAVLGIATFAACFTPPDVISMTIMAVPVYALYEISILLVSMIGKARDKEEAADLAAMRAQ